MAITLTIKISDENQTLLKNDLLGDAGIDVWTDGMIKGEVNRGYKKMRTKYDPILFDDASVSSIPSDKTKYINLVTARSDYTTAKQDLKK